ncbi:MAG: PocR ligand-binding domain-containing protein, partial [Spirochaetia bacterium]|nr:PocR ligand-binding domain-containing protein [Spirochaetia bacterium]
MAIPEFYEWLDHVARRTGALVNFEDLAGYTYQIPQLALRANQIVHDGPYCRFAKNHGGLQACRDNKKRAVAEALRRGGAYEGLCFRGVWDCVHPVFYRGEAIGVFFLGGFLENAELTPVDGARFAGPSLPRISDARKKELRGYA